MLEAANPRAAMEFPCELDGLRYFFSKRDGCLQSRLLYLRAAP